MPDHDSAYKRLFSHARMVKDLLRGFALRECASELDFSSLEQFKANLVGDRSWQRLPDLIWRLRWKGEWLYVILEFQSTVKRFMAVRMAADVVLLYQELIRQKMLTRAGKLPPVLPLVLYNGVRPWKEPADVGQLTDCAPRGMGRYLLRLEHKALDEGRIEPGLPRKLGNLAAALFRLEGSRDAGELTRNLDGLFEFLKDSEQALLCGSFAAGSAQKDGKCVG